MIPKVIHYCWFGKNELSELNKKCIDSWKKFLPDYEIKEWNDSNYDFSVCKYVEEAYERKKYAFVSDYARFDILYKYGGLYFDTDVELINGIDDIIESGPFMALETGKFRFDKYDSSCLKADTYDDVNRVTLELGFSIAPGLGLGVYKNHKLYKKILDKFSKRSFIDKNGNNNCLIICDFVTEILVRESIYNNKGFGIVDDINIYPVDYFCPKDSDSEMVNFTKDTRAIHHYGATWRTPIEAKIHKILAKNIQKYGAKKGRKIAQIKALPYSIINKIQQKGLIWTIRFILNKLINKNEVAN